MKFVIFMCLLLGFFLLFHETRLLADLYSLLEKTRSGMDASARQRTLEERRRLMTLQEEHSFLWYLEKQLRYSGLRQHFPHLTAEWWIVWNLAAIGMIFALAVIPFGIGAAVIVSFLPVVGEMWILRSLRIRNLKKVNENLLKLLDFLENYSITAGELTGVLGQVGRYMEEPLRSALEICCIEARTTGDTGQALLAMAEYIEHPKFKELARNMEISVRYCTDFSTMVNSSRRSMREYLRMLQERRGMLREAFVNMTILLGMSMAVLAVVGNLVAFPIWTFLWRSLPGHIALGTVLLILGLFAGQVRKIQV